MKHRAFRPFSKTTAIKLAVFISFILNAILLLGLIYSKNIENVHAEKLFFRFVANVLSFYLLYVFIFGILKLNYHKHRKALYILIGSIVITLGLSFAFTSFELHFIPGNLLPDRLIVIMNLVKDLIVLTIVLLSTSQLYSFNERQLTLFENERLTADNIRIRYEILKNQVNPHFLFNSLNTLDGLIGMDNERAHEYVQNLSQVFRYTIGNKEIMHLDEELDFTESYALLMKIRYGDNLQIQYNIDDKYRSYYIIPVSLQLLVENAIKHNVVSSKHPLLITIETTPNDSIRVTNAIQPQSGVEHGEGIGLANLTERYELLFQKEVIITKTDVFSVEIPLQKQLPEHNGTKTTQNESSYSRR